MDFWISSRRQVEKTGLQPQARPKPNISVRFQTIVSRIILESGICSLPANNSLWQQVKLAPAETDDSGTCFHGSEFGNCDRTNPVRPYGCKWWHFHSIERKADLVRKFKEIDEGQNPPTKAEQFVIDVGIEVERILGIRT